MSAMFQLREGGDGRGRVMALASCKTSEKVKEFAAVWGELGHGQSAPVIFNPFRDAAVAQSEDASSGCAACVFRVEYEAVMGTMKCRRSRVPLAYFRMP
ncbi:unnamed protein product [Toxocara canis]|uniref:DUF3700 domain-containing protein n=1 Tax=Toxocara canis TaxID=6265 RepID=A0A183U6Q6_TOXCA|nr:unnamed protein product [Toxocara canis]